MKKIIILLFLPYYLFSQISATLAVERKSKINSINISINLKNKNLKNFILNRGELKIEKYDEIEKKYFDYSKTYMSDIIDSITDSTYKYWIEDSLDQSSKYLREIEKINILKHVCKDIKFEQFEQEFNLYFSQYLFIEKNKSIKINYFLNNTLKQQGKFRLYWQYSTKYYNSNFVERKLSDLECDNFKHLSMFKMAQFERYQSKIKSNYLYVNIE